MDDRELLELAARATGFEIEDDENRGLVVLSDCGVEWNPLTDDGDALRLAVRLHMSVTRETGEAIVTAGHGPMPISTLERFKYVDQGEYAAALPAIVRAPPALSLGQAP